MFQMQVGKLSDHVRKFISQCSQVTRDHGTYT